MKKNNVTINPTYLARNINNARAGLIPKHPTSLEFELQHDSIQPNFLVADIKVNKKYIIIVIFNLYTYYKIVNQIIK